MHTQPPWLCLCAAKVARNFVTTKFSPTFLYVSAQARLGRALGARWARGAYTRSRTRIHMRLWLPGRCTWRPGAAATFCPVLKMQG